jgi:hypothetical protein
MKGINIVNSGCKKEGTPMIDYFGTSTKIKGKCLTQF